jgi:NAD(P)-dependent dehydrogenase (short-subunit alcohol dehydrogenase family)
MTMTTQPASAGTALVTGAAMRIGRAVATDLAAHGWAVGVHYNRSRAEAEAVVAEIAAAGGRAAALGADLASPAAVERLVPEAAGRLGPLTLLVNNASVFENDTVENLSQEGWREHIDVNLRAPVFLSQAFARQLPADAEGNIVNIIDMRVWRLTPLFLSYTVSKAGLWTATQTLAMALAPRIRVNGIGPGPVLPSKRQTREQFERQCRLTPLGHGTAPAEIAAAVRFIVASPSMTGQMIALDGGQHLPWRPPAKREDIHD